MGRYPKIDGTGSGALTETLNFFVEPNTRTLTAKTAHITMNMGEYGSPHVGFYWFVWGAPSVTLLKNRRYHLIDLNVGGAHG